MRPPGAARRAAAEASDGHTSVGEEDDGPSRTRAQRARISARTALSSPLGGRGSTPAARQARISAAERSRISATPRPSPRGGRGSAPAARRARILSEAGDDDPNAANKTKLKATKHPKALKNKNSEIEHFKTRLSIYRIRELAPSFDDDQNTWINEAGFGSLLSMAEFSIPVKLVRWMMKYMDPLLSEFRYRSKVIVFNRDLVCKILGLPNGNVPLKLSDDWDDVKDLREEYKDGERAKIKKCIQVLQHSKDRKSFIIRAFTLLAFGSVYCPGTGNYVSLKYLHCLVNISELKKYDWAGHIIETLMDEVKKYQKFNTRWLLEHDHQIGSCLPILAIAYMDHLNIPTDRGSHQINYSLPRICNVTNEDFEFVMKVDRNRMSMDNVYGKLPFRDFRDTPYATAPPLDNPVPPEEVPIASSATLDDWLHQPGASSQVLNQLPPEYHQIIVQYNNLAQQDVDELAEAVAVSVKEKIKAIWSQRRAEMMNELGALSNQNKGPEPADEEIVAPKAPITAILTTESADKVIEICSEAKAHPSSSIDLDLNPHPSPSHLKISEYSNFCNDIPSFDLFKHDDPEYPEICGLKDGQSDAKAAGDSTTPPASIHGDAAKFESIHNSSGTSMREKINRRKRAAIILNFGKKPKKIKLDEDIKIACNTYVSKKLRLKEATEPDDKKQNPPFVQIASFHVSYDEFYESFKPRGKIDNNVMALWTYQFNLHECDLREQEKNVIKIMHFPLPSLGSS